MVHRAFGARGPTKPAYIGKLVEGQLTGTGVRLLFAVIDDAPDKQLGRPIFVPLGDSDIAEIKRIIRLHEET